MKPKALPVFLAILLLSAPAFAQSAKDELRQIGNVMGYATGCALDFVPKETQDPEGAEFGQRLARDYLNSGVDVTYELMMGVNMGMLAKGSSGGAQCHQALEAMVKLANNYGLSGNFWKGILQKYDGAQGGRSKGQSSALRPNEFVGKIEEFNQEGMNFLHLLRDGSDETIMLGYYNEFEGDPQVEKCVTEAVDKGYRVKVSGNVQTYEDGSKSIDAKGMTCKIISK